MAKIYINNQIIHAENNSNLYQTLIQNGIFINAPCGGMGICGKCMVNISGMGTVKSCEYSVNSDITVTLPDSGKISTVTEGRLRDVPATDKSDKIAVDLGTTTIAAYFIRDGRILDCISRSNAQKPYGDDVISRIKFTMDNPRGTEILHKIAYSQITEMAEILKQKNNSDTRDIAVAANTTMLHLLANISPASIGVSPFTPVFLDERKFGDFTLLPSISGYVGADITAGIFAAGIHESAEISLLIDIGTNGEIALGNRDFIITCAAAAGPAFEGTGITWGMAGTSGAINRISIGENREISYSTIDNAPPKGLCGSGILDAAAEMLRRGIIDETGYFEDEELTIAYTESDSRIIVNSRDIRQIQLAKAAIAAGIQTLIHESGINPAEIKKCYLAGGFGSHLKIKNALIINLIPSASVPLDRSRSASSTFDASEFKDKVCSSVTLDRSRSAPPTSDSSEFDDKICSIGNAAGMGTVLWQINPECRRDICKIAENAKYIELSGNHFFNQEFINQMEFSSASVPLDRSRSAHSILD